MVTQVTFELSLSEEEIREARESGLLTSEAYEQWVLEQLQWKRNAKRIQEIRDALQELPEPLTLEEIEAELAAYEAEKRARRARRD